MQSIIPVILSGGSGSRIWPLSRHHYPKQFLTFINELTMLQNTILRLDGLDGVLSPIIVCNSDHRFLVAEQCKQINIKNPTILLEPKAKNTAPAIAAAVIQALKNKKPNSQDPLLLILPADNIIEDVPAFHKAINIATLQAEAGKIITFGVVPNGPNTNYGYIHADNNLGLNSVSNVKSFHEKPDHETASQYIKINSELKNQGLPIEFFWNSGMFMFKATTLINELNTYAPGVLKAAKSAIQESKTDLEFIRMANFDFEQPIDNSQLSIDYVLIEKSNNVVAVKLNAGWNDLGSWPAIYEINKKDKNANVLRGDVFVEDVSGSYINANHHMVVAIGVKDLIVVDTPDATFVSTREKAHEVKNILEVLKRKGREEQFSHRKVHRPWGWFDSIEAGENFQVKKLHIAPFSKLSLQLHHKRSEHWIVVSGIAKVTKADDVFTLNVGESTFIPIAVKHSLENETSETLEIIEVQSGNYLGEDDIERFEDLYGRF